MLQCDNKRGVGCDGIYSRLMFLPFIFFPSVGQKFFRQPKFCRIPDANICVWQTGSLLKVIRLLKKTILDIWPCCDLFESNPKSIQLICLLQ